jgi:PAS domain-containing protein
MTIGVGNNLDGPPCFFRSVLELAPDGLMVVDQKGVIRLANAQCEKLFGHPRDELIGQFVEMLARTPASRFANAAGHPLPERLEQIVLACLEKTPERRPSSAVELWRQLGEIDGRNALDT